MKKVLVRIKKVQVDWVYGSDFDSEIHVHRKNTIEKSSLNMQRLASHASSAVLSANPKKKKKKKPAAVSLLLH